MSQSVPEEKRGDVFLLVPLLPLMWSLSLLSDPWAQDISLSEIFVFAPRPVSLSVAVPCWTSVFGVKYLDYLKGWRRLGHPSSFSFFKPKLLFVKLTMLSLPLAQVSRSQFWEVSGPGGAEVLNARCGEVCRREVAACREGFFHHCIWIDMQFKLNS